MHVPKNIKKNSIVFSNRTSMKVISVF